MTPFMDSQELATRFNEDEAVWRRYEQNRGFRRACGLRTPLPEQVLDALDWLDAEQECRKTSCIARKMG